MNVNIVFPLTISLSKEYFCRDTILNWGLELTGVECFFDEVQFLITGGMGAVAV